MVIDDNELFEMFDIFQARTVLNEYDHESILNSACEHFQCDRNNLTANMFLAFVYALKYCNDS